MPSWFKKVFTNGEAKPKSPGAPEPSKTVRVATPPTIDNPALGKPDTSSFEEDDRPRVRTVLHAPIIVAQEDQSSWSEAIKIKARVEADRVTCVFMVDRPVLSGYSAWFPGAKWAHDASPLAEEIFKIAGVGSVLIHDMTVSVGMSELNDKAWDELAPEVGTVIRAYLKSGEDTITKAFRDSLPGEEEIRMKVQACIDLEINPGIASHSGVVTLERIVGNSVFLTMGGGCQGCAASAITLRQGIHTTFRNAVPQIGGIFDETDHTAGTNPFYNELPAGMA